MAVGEREREQCSDLPVLAGERLEVCLASSPRTQRRKFHRIDQDQGSVSLLGIVLFVVDLLSLAPLQKPDRTLRTSRRTLESKYYSEARDDIGLIDCS